MITRLMTAAAAAALLVGAAQAQTAAPAPATRPSTTAPAAATTPARVAPAATGAASASTPAASGDLVATATAAGTFTTLLKGAEATNLTPVLKSPGPLTVFAPTDAAFAALPAGELDRLMQPANRAELQKLLLAHIVNTSVPSSELAGKKGEVQNGAGANLSIDGTDGVTVNGAKVVKADVRASNGIIHVIDRVILPGAAPSATAAAPSASSDAADTSSVTTTDTPPVAARPATTPAPAARPATPPATPQAPPHPAAETREREPELS